jgi:hypothetical protein
MRTLYGNPTARPKPLLPKRRSTVVGAVRDPPQHVTREKLPSGTESPQFGSPYIRQEVLRSRGKQEKIT